jgi:tripartite-type tricarboxylate transporter receptor subunit TctC
VHVPYKGGGPAMADLVGGQVLLSFASMASAVPFVRAGRLRAIAVSGGERSALFPEVPTVAESGLAGFASEDWQGILAPAKTPPEIVQKLNAEIRRILLLPEVKAKLTAAGFDPKPSTPESFGQFIQAETLKWAKLLKGIGIKAQ